MTCIQYPQIHLSTYQNHRSLRGFLMTYKTLKSHLQLYGESRSHFFEAQSEPSRGYGWESELPSAPEGGGDIIPYSLFNLTHNPSLLPTIPPQDHPLFSSCPKTLPSNPPQTLHWPQKEVLRRSSGGERSASPIASGLETSG